MNSAEKGLSRPASAGFHPYWELIAQPWSAGMWDGIKNVINIRAQLFCAVGWRSEMHKRLDLIWGRPQRSRREALLSLDYAQNGPSAESPGRPKAPLRGVSTKLKNNDTLREKLMPVPIIKSHIPHCFAFNFCFFSSPLSLSVSDSFSFPSALLFSSLFSIRTPLAVAERYSHFQRLGCHAPPLSPVWNFNVHVVRVPSGVIDRSVPEQHRAWQAGCLLSEAAEEKQQREGAEEEKTYINKTKLLLPISQ